MRHSTGIVVPVVVLAGLVAGEVDAGDAELKLVVKVATGVLPVSKP